jgi:muramidase (phage lysozyme)
VEGKQEETNGGSLVKKDFVLVGKGGRQDVGVPSPISGYVRTSSNFGTVEIYKDPAFKELMGRILHLSDFAVKTGDQVNRGQNLGTQGGRGVGGRQGAYGVHFHGEFTPDVWKPYIKSLISGDFGSISNAFKGTGLDKAWNNLLGNKPKVENSSVTSYKDSVSNTANTKDDAGLTKLGQKYASLLNDPRVTAFLRSIAIAEVGSNLVGKGQGYGKLAGGDYSKEEIADPSKITNIPGGRYKPFGRYQINNVDVEYAKKELGIQNLSPRNQDIIGVQRLAMRGAIEPLLAGNIDQAMRLAGKEFASLEGSPWIGKHGNKVTAGGSRSAFMQNYQHGLSQKNLVTSYNSSDGRKDTVENSSVTSYKIQPQESAFIQNYRRNLGNQVLGTSLRGETLTPEQMQSTVREGLKAGLSAERGTLSVQQKKSDLEIKIAQDKIAQEALRILNQQRENRRQEGEKIKDTQLDTLNREFGAKGTPTIREVNQNKLEGIFREFDKTISQRTRELKLTNDAITQGERFIQTPGVTEAQKAETQKGLEVLRQSKAVTEDSITRLTKARETAISENARLFKNQVSQRDFIQQNELLQNTVTGLQTKISSLKILQALKPLDPRVQEIPDLEKAVALRQVTLDANKQINDIQQKVFTKEIENPQIAADMIANAKELARLKQKDIELTYEQAKANQLAANIALQLQRQQIFLDSQTGLNKEKSALIQFASRNSATSKDLTAQMKLEEENLTSKLNYDKLKETLRQQAAQGLISDGEYKGLRVTGAISNNLKMKNSRNDYEQSLMDTKQKYTQYLGQSESDVLNARASQENRRLGGNQFVANEYQRKAATLQENIKYAKELQQIEQDISNQKALGIDVTGLEAVKTNMQEIHSLNLEGINAQFKTFGETINSVAADSLKSLSQGLTDVILKGGSIGDVFQNMAQTILSSIINSGLSNLLGSLFGGGRPAKTGGVIMDILGGGGGESSPFGFIGSLFGGILGFAGGGDISYANMGDLRKGNHPIAKALSKEGSNSVLAALTPGERVLTVQENRKFKQLLGNNYQVLNFKTGGEVGMLNVASDNVAKYAKSGNQAINIDASIEENNKTPDERSLAKAIRTVVIAELARQKEVRR